MAKKAARFRLQFVNAAEDIPRVIRAYGKACAGEFALVLRPAEKQGVLVLIGKAESRFWRSKESDAPVLPEKVVEAKQAVAEIKAAQQAVAKEGPATLRGQWSGWMVCNDGVPRVELQRKLASYGVLMLFSEGGRWKWRVERTEKWFSKPGKEEGAAKTLVEAIQAGLVRAMGLLGEACSVRDSRRRAAVDEEYGKKFPVKKVVKVKEMVVPEPKEKKRKVKAVLPVKSEKVDEQDQALIQAFSAALAGHNI